MTGSNSDKAGKNENVPAQRETKSVYYGEHSSKTCKIFYVYSYIPRVHIISLFSFFFGFFFYSFLNTHRKAFEI